MATLTNEQLKDSYQSLVTIGDSITSDPTSGQLENGKGTPLTAVGIGTNTPLGKLDVVSSESITQARVRNQSTGSAAILFQNSDTGTGNDDGLYLGRAAGINYLWTYENEPLVLATNNSEKMRIHSTGDISFRDGSASEAFYWDASAGSLGIGTTSPFTLIEANGSSTLTTTGISSPLGLNLRNTNTTDGNYTTIQNRDGNGDQNAEIKFFNVSHANNQGAIAFTTRSSTGEFGEKMRIDSSGNVGIGTDSPTSISGYTGATLDNSTNGGFIDLQSNGVTAFRFLTNGSVNNIETRTATPIVFLTNTAERMRITSGGDVYVGKTVGTYTTDGVSLSNIGSNMSYTNNVVLAVNRNGTDGGAIAFYKDGSGVGSISVTASATAYNTSSDYRLKENVVELTGALDRVDQLKPSRFNFIADADTTVDGFLAHEVAEIVPNAVTGEKDAVDEEGNPMYQGIDHSKLVPILVGAIQELKAEIEQLKAK